MKAHGKYIFGIAGDDYLCDSQALRKMVEFLDDNEEYYQVSSWYYVYKEQNQEMCAFYNKDNYVAEYSLYDFLRGIPFPTLGASGMFRNTLSIDKETDYLAQGARNNEEIKMHFYLLSHGKKYILPEYFYVYRSVKKEGASNYNSTHTLFDTFKENYFDLLMLKKQFGNEYNFNPLILKRSNFWCLRICDNLEKTIGLFKVMKLQDKIKFFVYKCYLKFHNYQEPIKWSNPRYYEKH